MGDTLGLIYPHGEFVQPNLPPPDFDKEILFQTLENISKYDLSKLAIAHFGMHDEPYRLLENAYKSIESWINFITSLHEISDEDAASLLINWVKTNYEILLVDNLTIENYIKNMNPVMQVTGIRNYLNKKNP